MEFSGKVAVVTAAAGAGIGQACARAFAQAGANVVVTDAHAKRPLSVAEDIAGSTGVKTLGIQCDVSDKGQVENMAKATLQEFGKIDILVNSAGVNTSRAPTVEMTDEDWGRTLAVNLTGTFYCCRAVLPHMIAQKWGRIINMGSVAGFWGSGNTEGCAYSATKAGIFALTRVLAIEVGQHGITVNALAPIGIYNEFLWRDPEVREKYLVETPKQTPVGRVGRPEDIAHAVLFFASEESSYITGDILVVSGGRIMRAA